MITNDKSKVRFTVISSATVATIFTVVPSLLTSKVLASSDADYSFTLTSNWQDCQQISSSYQTIYAFETASFYISICQKDQAYFYLGEAKQKENSSIFLPAYPLEKSNGFQAENGNVSYLVLLPFGKPDNLSAAKSQPKEAILTIKRNDRLISVESSLNKYCRQSATVFVWDTIELQPHNSNQWANIPAQDAGLNFSLIPQSDRLLPTKVLDSNSRFDFYRLGGELYRLTTC